MRCCFRLQLTLSCALLLLANKYCDAQPKRVDISIAGPWAYAVDNRNPGKIILIAPAEPNHTAPEVLSGADVTHPPSSKETTHAGIYEITLDNAAAQCPSGLPPSTADLFPLNGVDQSSVIQPLIDGKKKTRYAFVLPKPCYYSSLRTDHSRVSLTPIPNTAAGNPSFTTWMVFHYFVDTVDSARLSGSSDDGTFKYDKFPIPFSTTAVTHTPGISVMLEPLHDDTVPNDCDPISVKSVQATGDLFEKTLNVWMPSVDTDGNQQGYVPGCQNAQLSEEKMLMMDNAAAALNLAVHVLRQTKNPTSAKLAQAEKDLSELTTKLNALKPAPPARVKQELIIARKLIAQESASFKKGLKPARRIPADLSQTTAYLYFFTPGSADCKGAQLNVDGTL